jgi:hypothetical protein
MGRAAGKTAGGQQETAGGAEERAVRAREGTP